MRRTFFVLKGGDVLEILTDVLFRFKGITLVFGPLIINFLGHRSIYTGGGGLGLKQVTTFSELAEGTLILGFDLEYGEA